MENKYVLHNFIVLALFVPKIIKVSWNLTKLWQKQFWLFFSGNMVYISVHIYIHILVSHFYARKQLCFQRVLAIAILSLCPSVCPSHGWISQKRCKIELPNLYHRLPGRL